MANFCIQCGIKLEEKASACTSCGNPVPLTSSIVNKKLIEDLKNKFQQFSSKVQDTATKAAEDISQEAKKINEARLQASEQSNFEQAENKKAAIFHASLNFWSRLSNKQKGICIGLPLFLFVCLMSILNLVILAVVHPTLQAL